MIYGPKTESSIHSQTRIPVAACLALLVYAGQSLGAENRWARVMARSKGSLRRKNCLVRKFAGKENSLRAENHWVRKFASVEKISWGDCVYVSVNDLIELLAICTICFSPSLQGTTSGSMCHVAGLTLSHLKSTTFCACHEERKYGDQNDRLY
jgi:hypothetical protein